MRILLFIVGVGAGNTTRNIALIQELRRQEPGIDVHVAAQGRAAELLADLCPVHPMRSVTYAESGGMSAWNIVRSNLAFPVRFFQNRAAARKLVERLKPDVVMADSDFYCLGVVRRSGVPLASLNNAEVIVAALKQRGIPPGCGFSARFIERIDAWLQRRYPQRVICPTLQPERGLPEKFIQIPPIVRPDLTPSSEEGQNVVVVTGGSGLGVDEIDLRGLKVSMVTYGTKLKHVPPYADQRGFSLDAFEAMRHARVLVVQGGFSSISEAVALRRPTVVLPIRGHAEQHVNARIFEELGLGLASAGPGAGVKVRAILSRYDQFWERCQSHTIPTDGHIHAARALLEMVER